MRVDSSGAAKRENCEGEKTRTMLNEPRDISSGLLRLEFAEMWGVCGVVRVRVCRRGKK